MKEYEIAYKGLARVRAENELDAEESFSNGDVLYEQRDVMSITEVQDVRSEEGIG